MLSVSDSAGAFTYGYDTAGRNISVTRPDAKAVSYQYDAAGNRTRVTWPDAVFVTYSYDELNRMKEVRLGGSTLLAKYDWDALSRRSKLTFGNNTTATYAYQPNDDLASIRHQLKQSAVTFSYGYNRAGQRTRTDVTDDRYLFRPAANENLNYAANPLNQYTLVGSAALSYDANGNLTGDGVSAYTYDTESRLTGFSGQGKTASYAYDPLGRRKAKTVGTVTTSYLHDGDREIAEYDGSGALLRRYVYGVNLDEPLVQITRTGTRFYYRADALGSIVAHEEHSSSFVQRFNYGPFGESSTATGHPFRYTARRIDEETGLYYYRARYYSPQLGRFLQADPIGYEGGINLYAYVGNDPTNFVDPNGLYLAALSGYANAAWGLTQQAVQPLVNAYQNTFVAPLQSAVNALAGTPLADPGLAASLQGMGPPGAMTGGLLALGGSGLRALSTVARAEDVGARLQRITSQATREVDALGNAAFTPAQQAAIAQHPNLMAAYRGSSIDARARQLVAGDPALRGRIAGARNNGPDFIDTITGNTYDMTTLGQVGVHVQKYGPNLIPLLTIP